MLLYNNIELNNSAKLALLLMFKNRSFLTLRTSIYNNQYYDRKSFDSLCILNQGRVQSLLHLKVSLQSRWLLRKQ